MHPLGYSVAIVGATGEVGKCMIKTLERYPIPVRSLRLLASKRSVGKKIQFRNQWYEVEELNETSFEGVELALFSAGGSISEIYAPIAVRSGAVVVDNTSAFRMQADIPLVVPEVNADTLTKETKLIANPNCSTIQLVVALKPLADEYGVESVNVSTYQAISGAGAKALEEFDLELQEEAYEPKILPTRDNLHHYQIAHNVIPQIDKFLESGYTKEEIKMINETKKILDNQMIKVNATCVRVPVRYGHSVSATVKLKRPVTSRQEILDLFKETPNVILLDNIDEQSYPMPYYLAGKDEVYVGRIRKDLNEDTVIHLFIVADNILKGAALNSVQIAYYMHRHGLLGDE
ncbi:MAG TPA: aspartate-semialdehyde dehydrogenase [Firmicutes bacterium]|nr:aspartate-semialdehyde dehydrogenase [Bacillota bacterium]